MLKNGPVGHGFSPDAGLDVAAARNDIYVLLLLEFALAEDTTVILLFVVGRHEDLSREAGNRIVVGTEEKRGMRGWGRKGKGGQLIGKAA